MSTSNAQRCPECHSRVASFETECPNCGASLSGDAFAQTSLGRAAQDAPRTQGASSDGRADRTAFGIHVLDAASGGTMAPAAATPAPPVAGPSATSTAVGQRLPGFGAVAPGTAVGVRPPLSPRDADSTSLNALGSAALQSADEQTVILRAPDPASTMLGVSVRDHHSAPEEPSTRPKPQQFSDDWLDEIHEYLVDHESEDARGIHQRPDSGEPPPDTPSPQGDAPAFGIMRRAWQKGSAPASMPAPVELRRRESPEVTPERALAADDFQAVARITPRPNPARRLADEGDAGPHAVAPPPAVPLRAPPIPAPMSSPAETLQPLLDVSMPPAAVASVDDLPADVSLHAAPSAPSGRETSVEPSSAPIGASLEPSNAYDGVTPPSPGAPDELESALASDFLMEAAARTGQVAAPPARARVTRPVRSLAPTARPVSGDAMSKILWAAVVLVALVLVGIIVFTTVQSSRPLPGATDTASGAPAPPAPAAQ